MSMTLDQEMIDARIHRFMARKSPVKTLSKSIAEHLAVNSRGSRNESGGIAYEQTTWHRRRVHP